MGGSGRQGASVNESLKDFIDRIFAVGSPCSYNPFKLRRFWLSNVFGSRGKRLRTSVKEQRTIPLPDRVSTRFASQSMHLQTVAQRPSLPSVKFAFATICFSFRSHMTANLVMTIIGPDRPGLVETLASIITSHGGNWLESRMGHLGGQFAGILRVQAPEASVESITRELRELESDRLTVVVNRGQSHDFNDSSRKTMALEIIGLDRPGIVAEITRVLAGFTINVEELETECSSAPMSGEMMFQARARVVIPETCDVLDVRAELERIAADLMVELRLEQQQTISPK